MLSAIRANKPSAMAMTTITTVRSLFFGACCADAGESPSSMEDLQVENTERRKRRRQLRFRMPGAGCWRSAGRTRGDDESEGLGCAREVESGSNPTHDRQAVRIRR